MQYLTWAVKWINFLFLDHLYSQKHMLKDDYLN